MRLHRFHNLAALRDAFPAFATNPAVQSPFETLDWYDLLSSEVRFTEGPQQIELVADAGAALCLPLQWQGRELRSLSNYYTGLYGPLLIAPNDPKWQDAALTALFRRIRRDTRPPLIDLQPLDPGGVFFSSVRNALAQGGYCTDDYFCFGNWYLPCRTLGYQDYLKQRPSALRHTLRRARQKLNNAGHWEVTRHTTPGGELEAAIVEYEAIYQRSWKPSESHPGFVRALCRLAARHGWLRLGVLRLNGRAIASQIWLFDNGKAYIFKLAYDPDAARFSPGSTLTAAMMEFALDHDRADEIDYLSGDDRYKRDWMSHRRERRGLLAFDLSTLHGLSKAARHFAGRAWRRFKQ